LQKRCSSLLHTLSTATGNLPNVPWKEEDQQFRDIDTEESFAVQDSLPLSPSQPLPSPPPPFQRLWCLNKMKTLKLNDSPSRCEHLARKASVA
jgi:hypothetical protein